MNSPKPKLNTRERGFDSFRPSKKTGAVLKRCPVEVSFFTNTFFSYSITQDTDTLRVSLGPYEHAELISLYKKKKNKEHLVKPHVRLETCIVTLAFWPLSISLLS